VKKLRDLLAQVAEKLGLSEDLLARAQRRYKANRKRAYTAHNDGVRWQAKADGERLDGRDGAHEDREARRAHARAYKNHLRAQHYLGVIKTLTARIEKLDSAEAQYTADLKELSHVTISGNKATGGSRRQRLKAVALSSAARCARGQRRNFYSQLGSWDVDHCLTGEAYGERSDCSSWVTSVYKSCDLPDPNGQRYTGGYTGTLVANGKQVDSPKPGDLVIYGSGTGHHVELYVGPGDKTIGHGSAPVDPGVIDLFGDGDYRFFSYL
jgi:cell wall-associated NlpC family hydrolase